MFRPIYNITGFGLLKGLVRGDERSRQQPTLDAAIEWSDNWKKESRLYVDPLFLLKAWEEVRKEKDDGIR